MSVPPPVAGYTYWAFLSYSHKDNLATRGEGSGDHIRWANWLHEQLETYRIPDGYGARATRSGEPMPERFFPTFRDEAELPTSPDLGAQIRDALNRSRFLIVIASPRSACSRYVNEEVRYFRQLGRGDRILTLIVDGEPNVRLTPKPGWTPDSECFCPALVHPLRPDGSVDDTTLLREEPLAADVRVRDVERPCEMRASERDQPARRALLDFMKLKLIAGLMGAGLDELVQRDKRRQFEAARQRARNLKRWLAAVGLLALIAIVGGSVAYLQRSRAVVAEKRTQEQFQRAESQRNYALGLLEVASLADYRAADEAMTQRDWAKGIALLGRALRYRPETIEASTYLWHAIAQVPYASRSLPFIKMQLPAGWKDLHISARGEVIVVLGADGSACRVVREPGTESGSCIPLGIQVRRVRLHPKKPHGIFVLNSGEVALWDLRQGRQIWQAKAMSGAVLDCIFLNGILLSKEGGVWTIESGGSLVWRSLANGSVNGVRQIHPGATSILAVSSDGDYALTHAPGLDARVWDLADRMAIGPPMTVPEPVEWGWLSYNGKTACLRLADQLHSWKSDGTVNTRGHESSNSYLNQIVSAGGSRAIHVDNHSRVTSVEDEQVDYLFPYLPPPGAAIVSPRGRWVGFLDTPNAPDPEGSGDVALCVTQLHDARPDLQIIRGRIAKLFFSNDDLAVATVTADGTAYIWPLPELFWPVGWTRVIFIDDFFAPDPLLRWRMVFDSAQRLRLHLNATKRPVSPPLLIDYRSRRDSIFYPKAKWQKGFLTLVHNLPEHTITLPLVQSVDLRPEPWLMDFIQAVCGFVANDDGMIVPVPLPDRLAARERLRRLKLTGPNAEVRDPEWARLLKWWLTPVPERGAVP